MDLIAQWEKHFPNNDAPKDTKFDLHSIQWYLDKAAREFPKRKAVIFQNLTYTYAQLQEKAEIMAASLKEAGLKTGDRVAVMMPNIPQTIVSVWGILKAGGVVVMTNPLYMEKELVHHFSDSRAKFLIILDLFWEKVYALYDKFNIQKYFVSTLSDGLNFPLNMLYPIKARRSGAHVDVKYDKSTIIPYKNLFKSKKRYSEYPEDPENTVALLQYTGGTTGFSKAAMLSHGNISANIRQLELVIGHGPEEEVLSVAVMPFFHIFGLTGTVFLPAFFASPTLPVPRYVPRDILELIKRYRPGMFIGAPSVYMGLMEQKNIKDYDLTCIDLCVVGAAPFPVDAMTRFANMTKANITEGLGLTECSPCICSNPIYGKKKFGSVGLPYPNTYIKIMDLETGTREVDNLQVGEVVVKGPQVMMGYWEKEEETANVLKDGWFYTGDIAYKDEEDYIFIVDRKKNMAIIGGYNVYPREIDEVLYEHPKVKAAASLAVPHKSRGEILKAYIVPEDGETLTMTEMVAYCKQKLANYKVPRMFEFREELPMSALGKVLARVLKDEEVKKHEDEKAGKEVAKSNAHEVSEEELKEVDNEEKK